MDLKDKPVDEEIHRCASCLFLSHFVQNLQLLTENMPSFVTQSRQLFPCVLIVACTNALLKQHNSENHSVFTAIDNTTSVNTGGGVQEKEKKSKDFKKSKWSRYSTKLYYKHCVMF